MKPRYQSYWSSGKVKDIHSSFVHRGIMTSIHGIWFSVSLLFLIEATFCLQQVKDVVYNDDAYAGMTDREIILDVIKQNADLVKLVRSLESQNVRQQRDIDALHTTVQKQQRKVDLLDQVFTGKNQTVKAQESTEPELNTGDIEQAASSDHVELQEQLRRRRQTGTVIKVAFFATATNHLYQLAAGQVLEFQNAVTNIGNAYSSFTGVFTAPYAGTYVFSVSLVGNTNTIGHYYVAKNRVSVSQLVLHGPSSPHATMSHTVILELRRGDVVEIRNLDAGETVNGDHFSSFSGFLLYSY